MGTVRRAPTYIGGAPRGYSEAYTVAPVVLGIAPASGPDNGNTAVVIQVDDSAGATGATVGGAALTGFAIVDGTHVSGTIPAGAYPDGPANVIVSNGAGASAPVADYTFVLSFNPLVGPAGSVPLWSYDADHVTVVSGDVTSLVNRGSIGTPAGDGTPYDLTAIPFIASSAAFGGKAALDGGNVANQNSRVGAGSSIPNSGARSWVFVVDMNTATFAKYAALLSVADYSNTIYYGKNVPGNLELGHTGTPQLSAAMPDNTPAVIIITLALDGSAHIYISALTAAASAPAGTVTVPAAAGQGMNIMGNGLLALNPVGGPWRWFQYYDVDLTATGEVAYYMNGFGADSSIAIGP